MFIKRAKLFIVQANTKLENMNIQGFTNFGKRVEAITPIKLNPEKYLYILNRAVSAYESYGPNQNHDAFEREELKKAYASFINAPVNFDHINNSIEDSTGIVIDAIWEEPVYKDGKLVDGDYVKNILAIDKEEAERKRPGCIQAILDGKMTDTSMGALCKESVCSECGHVAYDETQYCSCLKFHRGDVVYAKKVHANGITYGPHEYNRGITFFEDTIVTRDVGADKDAKFIAKIASTSKSVLIPYIISRVKEASMEKTAEQEKNFKVAPDANVAQKDVAEGAYGGDNSVKSKESFAEAKGKSEIQKDHKGNGLMEMEDKGDYVLATFKMSKEAYKKIADGENVLKMGGEPKEVENAKEKIDAEHKASVKPKMTEESKDKADAEEQENEDEEMIALSTLLRKGRITQAVFIEKMKEIVASSKHEAKETPKEETEHEIVTKVKEASLLSTVWDKVKKVVKEAATPQLQGEDKGDYGVDPKAVDKKIIDARANVGVTQTAKENAQPFATPEEREKKVELLKAEATIQTSKGLMRMASQESADKAVTYIADEMSKKRPYNEVVKEAYDKYGEKVEKTAAVEITDGNKTIKVTDDAVTTQPTESADIASSPSVAGDMGTKMAKRLAVIEKLEKGESVDIASALSTPETINSGNARTKVSPMTRAVAGDGAEFIKKADINVEKKLDEGNLDDKASPMTKLESELANARMTAKHTDDNQGNVTIEAMRREANMLKLELKKRDIVEVVNQMVVKGMIDDDEQAKKVAKKLLDYGAEQFYAFKESVAMVPVQMKKQAIEVPASNDLFQGMRTEASKGNDLDQVKWS